MKKKIVYKIIINGNTGKNCRSFMYDYGKTSDIELSMSPMKAVIQYKMGVKKDALSFACNPDNLVRDAMKKIFFVHVLLYGEKIRIKKISISIDGDTTDIEDHDSAVYGIHSMMAEKKIDLPDSWKTDEFISYLLSSTKSGGETDGRYSAICSFLVAESRNYEIDKFTNLWTAMNAYYTYIAYKGMSVMISRFGVDKELIKEIPKNDGKSLSVLMLAILNNPTRAALDTEDKIKDFRIIGDEIAALDDLEIINLYSQSFKALRNKELAKKLKEKYKYNNLNSKLKSLYEISQEMSIEIFFLLVFLFPYWCRCKFLHGRKPTLITVFDDEYELNYVKKVNILLELFLKDYLPISFEQHNFDDDLIFDIFSKLPKDKKNRQKIREYKVK